MCAQREEKKAGRNVSLVIAVAISDMFLARWLVEPEKCSIAAVRLVGFHGVADKAFEKADGKLLVAPPG